MLTQILDLIRDSFDDLAKEMGRIPGVARFERLLDDIATGLFVGSFIAGKMIVSTLPIAAILILTR